MSRCCHQYEHKPSLLDSPCSIYVENRLVHQWSETMCTAQRTCNEWSREGRPPFYSRTYVLKACWYAGPKSTPIAGIRHSLSRILAHFLARSSEMKFLVPCGRCKADELVQEVSRLDGKLAAHRSLLAAPLQRQRGSDKSQATQEEQLETLRLR